MNNVYGSFLLALVTLIIVSCQAVYTTPSSGGGKTNKGLAYYLPTSDFSISVTVSGEPDDKTKVVLLPASVLVADKNYPFRLVTSGNELFTRSHKYHVNDGLLSCIYVNDTGELGGVVDDLAKAAVIIASKNPAFGQVAADQVKIASDSVKSSVRTTPEVLGKEFWLRRPNRGEIDTILNSLASGEHKFVGASSERIDHALPGGGPFTVRVQGYLAGKPPKAVPQSSDAALRSGSKCYAGVFYRPTRKIKAHVKLYCSKGDLVRYRVVLFKELSTPVLNGLKAEQETLEQELKNMGDGDEDAVAKKTEEIKKKKSEVAQIANFINSSLRNAKTAEKSSGAFSLFHHASHIAVTDDTQLAYYPLPRSPVGATGNNYHLTMKDGVVLKATTDVPGAVKGISSIVLKTVRSIVSIPREAIVGKQSLLKEKQKLLDAQEKHLEERQKFLDERQKFLNQQKPGTAIPPANGGATGSTDSSKVKFTTGSKPAAADDSAGLLPQKEEKPEICPPLPKG